MMCFQSSLKIDNQIVEASYYIGVLMSKIKKYEIALIYFERSL